MSGSTTYSDAYRGIDFRKHPEKYVIGRGELGVLIAEPYKSEILPFWKFATPAAATDSAQHIYKMYEIYKRDKDFVGMDMARKYLQMGFTRSRRYANHSSGHKYKPDGSVSQQDAGSEDSEKAESARTFHEYYRRVLDDPEYQARKTEHKQRTA